MIVKQALVVDDHATNRLVLKIALEVSEFGAVEAENGAIAIELYEAAPFDLVLMDIQMPVVDGLAATRAIRQFEAANHLVRTPLIIVSAFCTPEDIGVSIAAGADLHFPKPLCIVNLLAAIDRLTSKGPELSQSVSPRRLAERF